MSRRLYVDVYNYGDSIYGQFCLPCIMTLYKIRMIFVLRIRIVLQHDKAIVHFHIN